MDVDHESLSTEGSDSRARGRRVQSIRFDAPPSQPGRYRFAVLCSRAAAAAAATGAGPEGGQAAAAGVAAPGALATAAVPFTARVMTSGALMQQVQQVQQVQQQQVQVQVPPIRGAARAAGVPACRHRLAAAGAPSRALLAGAAVQEQLMHQQVPAPPPLTAPGEPTPPDKCWLLQHGGLGGGGGDDVDGWAPLRHEEEECTLWEWEQPGGGPVEAGAAQAATTCCTTAA
jgi:hypothetical protein